MLFFACVTAWVLLTHLNVYDIRRNSESAYKL